MANDTQYETFQHYGTHADRLLFTPTPASGIQPIYIWYETDTNATFLYDTAWHQITAATGVATTGSPANGNLTKFSGAATITNGDLSGDISTTGTLVTAIGANKVTDAMIRQSGALTVVGRSANSTGNVADIAAVAASGAVLRESGSTVGFGTIATAGIANSAVTLAKIANASANDKLLGSGNSGSGAAYAEITLGSGLTMTGTTLSAAGSGGMVLLEQHTASVSASLDFTTGITSTYDTYLFLFVGIVPASNSRLRMLVSTDGGSTWNTSNVYRWNRLSLQGTATNGGTATSWDWQSGDDTLSSGGSYNGTFWLVNPLSASLNKIMYGQFTIDENVSVGFVPSSWGGTWRNTTAVNALQIKFASGNITSGTVRLYGLAK